jgi:hypothetical protein
MITLRSATAGLLATAMLATTAAPAAAQHYPGPYGGPVYGAPSAQWGGYRGGWNRGWDRRHHRRHDNTGAVVAGVIGVGILAAILASASKSNQNRANGTSDNRYGQIRTDDAAADACAVAAEQQIGGNARTRSIETVDRVSDGFNVRGTVEVARDRDQRSFNCSVRYGEVQRVDFGGYAYNGY